MIFCVVMVFFHSRPQDYPDMPIRLTQENAAISVAGCLCYFFA